MSLLVGSSILSGSANTITVSGLDGNTDKFYEVLFILLLIDGNADHVVMLPNGATGNGRSSTSYNAGSPADDTSNLRLLGAGGSGQTGREFHGYCRCFLDTMTPRFQSRGTYQIDQPTYVGDSTMMGWWALSDNLTSLSIYCTTANTFRAGSWMGVYRQEA